MSDYAARVLAQAIVRAAYLLANGLFWSGGRNHGNGINIGSLDYFQPAPTKESPDA